jgi:alkyl sulfatase BDS1-like metallo-beta-lactamase superfamily hydrolase
VPTRAIALLLAAALAACSSPASTVIDGSSAEAFSASTEQARQDLPPADRLDFDRALTSLPARRHSAADPEALRRTTFDGMTAAEVVKDFRQRQ